MSEHIHEHGDDCGCGHDHEHGHHHHHATGPVKTHRGVLAGLDEAARRKAIDDDMNAAVAGDHDRLIEILDERSDDAAPENSLPVLLAIDGEDALRDYAFAYGIDDADEMDADELAETFANLLTGTASELQRLLGPMRVKQLANIRALVEQGGWMEVPDAEVGLLSQYPTPVIPFVYIFHRDGVFTFVVPDEVMDKVGELDWDAIETTARTLEEAGRFIDAVTAMRGLIPVDELRAEWEALRPGALDDEGFHIALHRLDAYGHMLHPVVGIDDAEYAIHMFLDMVLEELEAMMGEDDDSDPVLPDQVLAVKAAHAMVEPCPVPEEVLAEEHYLDWLEKQPGVRTLRSFFDAHVPDSESDYRFSTNMIDLVYECVCANNDLPAVLEIVSEMGYKLAGDDLMAFMSALASAYNAIPNWLNNGWTPTEVDDHRIG